MDNKKLQAFIDDAVKKKLAPEGIGAYYSDTSDEVELKSLYDSIISRDKTGEIKERYSDYKQFRSYLDSDNAPTSNEQRSDIDFSQNDNAGLFNKFNASLDRTRKGVAPKEYKPKVAESESNTPSMVITPQELQSASKYYSGLNEFEPTKIGRTDKPFYLETPDNKEQGTTDTAPQEVEDFSKLSVDDYNKRISEIDKKIREIDERNKGNYNLALSAAAGMRGMQRTQPKMSEADQRERNALVAQKEFMESARNLTDFDNNRSQRYGFVAGLFKTPTAKNWLTFGINDMIDRLTINDIAQRWANNQEVSNTEKNAVLMYKQLDDLKNQERGLWYDVGQGTRLSLLFMAELAATGGAGGLAKAGGRAALERGISYALKRGMKSLGKQALNQAIKTPLMPTFYNTYLSNRLEGAEVDKGKLKFNSSVGKDLYYAAVDDWSGRFSESFGNVVSNVRLFKPLLANKQTNKFLMKTAQLLDKARGSNTYNIINNATRYAGVNSVPMEVAEEVFDNVTQSLLKFDAEPLKELATAKWWETTALTTLMLGGLGTSLRYGAGAAEILSDKKKIEQNLQGNINRLAAIDANDNGKNKVRDNLIGAINNGSLVGADGSIESSGIYKAYKRYRATFANDKQALDAADALIKSVCIARGSDMGLNAIMQDAIGGEFTYYPSDNNDVMIAYNQDGSVRGYVIDGSKETGWVIYNPNISQNEVVSDTEFSGIQTTTMPTSDFIAQSIVNTMPLPQGFNVGDLVNTQYGQGIVNSVNYDGSYEVITTNGEHYNLNDDEITLWQDNQPATPATPTATPTTTPPEAPQDTQATPIEVGSLVNYNGEEYEVSGIQTDNNGNRILTLQGAEGEPINVAESEVINQQTPATPQEPAEPQTPAQPQEPQIPAEPATQQTPAEPTTPQEQAEPTGQVNYDELLDTNPVAFVEQFMPIMGADITLAMLNGKREQLVSELAEHNKVLSNPTKATPNKLVEAKTRANAITKQLAEIDNAIAMLAPANAAEQEPATPQEPTEPMQPQEPAEPTQPQTPAEPATPQEPTTPAEEETTEEETTEESKTEEVETEEETPAEEETKEETPKEEEPKEPKDSGKRIVSDERLEELKKKLRKKLSNLNVGIDPELIAIGAEIGVAYIERGTRTFVRFSKSMINDFGNAIKPYLKMIYNAAREIAAINDTALSESMDNYEKVAKLDVNNIVTEERELELTADDIANSGYDNQETIDNAILYADGYVTDETEQSYNTILDYVRNQSDNSAADSTDAGGTQLGGTSDEDTDRDGGRDGSEDEQEDTDTDEGEVSEDRPSGEDGEDSMATPAGEQGDTDVPADTPDAPTSDSGDTAGGGSVSGAGDNVGERGGQKGSRGVSNEDADRRNQPVNVDTEEEQESVEGELEKDIKALLNDKQAIREKGLIAYVLHNSKVFNNIIKLMKHYIVNGLNTFERLYGKIYNFLNILLGDNITPEQIQDFIKECWNTNIKYRGEVRKMSEWAAILEQEELDKVAKLSIEEKVKLQKKAEKIDVKVGDRLNIRETLPFLLPKQQDDVLKAEVQFFDKSHNDELHAYGKGYMFTNGTGTGKTYTGLGIAKRFIKQGKGRILIVTAQESKIEDFIRDAKNLSINATMLANTNTKGKGVVVTQYANFYQNYKLLEDTFDLIIYDESHKIMENQQGDETSRLIMHNMMCNRDAQQVLLRQAQSTPLFVEGRELLTRSQELRKLIAKASTEELTEKEQERIREFGGVASMQVQLNSINQDIERVEREKDRYISNLLQDEKKLAEAEEIAKKTKVVFLSATPFNTALNLDYAEGYIFSYPDRPQRGTYETFEQRERRRGAFIMERFPSSHYRSRNGYVSRLRDVNITDPVSASEEEIRYSDYLQNTLNTMSGRQLDSPYDYSREFPRLDHPIAQFVNSAISALNGKYRALQPHFDFLYDYNKFTAFMEIIKTEAVIPRIKEHLKFGRKVAIYHRRISINESIANPFTNSLRAAAADPVISESLIRQFANEFAQLLSMEQNIDWSFPNDKIMRAFATEEEKETYRKELRDWQAKGAKGKAPILKSAKVAQFNGTISQKEKNRARDMFNDDNSSCNVIICQVASAKEGIDLHDKTGKHQRVLMQLSLPQSPIEFIQVEGRIYRIGSKSDAIFEYPIVGIDRELAEFATRINGRSETEENLSLGTNSRGLRESIARAALSNRVIPVTTEMGKGGKVLDSRKEQHRTIYDEAITNFYNWNKGKAADRFNTTEIPDPLGFKMIEWLGLENGDRLLVPFGGRGTVVAYHNAKTKLTAYEADQELYAELLLRYGGYGREFINDDFHNIANFKKYDGAILKTDDVEQDVDMIFRRLEISGRAIVVTKQPINIRHLSNRVSCEIKLPKCVFGEDAYISFIEERNNAAKQSIDISSVPNMDAFFEELRVLDVPKRQINRLAKILKKVEPIKAKIMSNPLLKKSRKNGKLEPDVWCDERGFGFTLLDKYGFKIKNSSYSRIGIRFSYILNGNQYQINDYAQQCVYIQNLLDKTDEELLQGELNDIYSRSIKDKFGDFSPLRELYNAYMSAIMAATGKTALQLKNISEGKVDNVLTGTMNVEQFRDAFESFYEGNEELRLIADRVFPIIQQIEGLSFKVCDASNFRARNVVAHYTPVTNSIELNNTWINSTRMSNEQKAATLLHEMIHACTVYYFELSENGVAIPPHMYEAVDMVKKAFDSINTNSAMIAEIRSGTTNDSNVDYSMSGHLELIAELSNTTLRRKLSNFPAYVYLINGKKIITSNAISGMNEAMLEQSTYLRLMDKYLDEFLTHYDADLYKAYLDEVQSIVGSGNQSQIRFRRVEPGSEKYAKLRKELIIEGKARLRATDAQMQLSDSNIGDKIEQVKSVAEALSEKYGVKVNVIESVDSITDSDGYLQRAKRGSKGWFDASTSEVFIVAPNADSIDDVKQTYLHEVVGHLGLAKLLGNQFKPVMDSIFRSMSLDEQIDYLRRFGDKAIAAEEYCAEMAENIDNANPTMLVKIKEIVLAGLRKIGINIPMSADSVMYLLWKSKRKLEKNATIRQQYDYIHTDNKLRFRMGLSNDYAMSGFDKFAQSIYDSLKPVNVLTDIIKQRGGDLSNNPVTKELLRSSKSKNEFDKFTEGFFKPILSAMAEIQRAAGNAFKTQDEVIQFINHTLIALHAAERNKYVACSNIANYAYPYLSRAFINSVGGREAAKALVMQLTEKMYDNQMRGIVNELGNGSVYDESLYTSEQCTEIDNIIVKMRDAKIGNDDITLSAMDDTNNNLSGYSDTEARDVLKESYEKVNKTQWKDLSAAIKRATDEIINIYFRHNILDAQAASRIKSMYKNYVPLREWEETDGTEYTSFGKGGTATPAYIRRAEGRKSLAEEPIAEIGKMAMSAIMMGGKNDVMVSAFRLAENNISNEDLFEIPVVYEVTDDETGEIELWLERPPQALFDAGRVKTTRSKGNYNWHKTSKQQEAHAIKAVIKGVQHIAYYQGTIGVESVAALKGLNNANINNQLLQYASGFTRWINANRTSRNPVFLVKNMIRDMMFAFFTYSAKGHNPLRLASNLPKAFTDIWRESMGGNPSSDYVNFLNNGGRTGYLDIRKGDINEIKKDYKKMVNAMRKGKLTDSRAYKAFASVYNLLNNLSETTMRYATYLSEMQRGETMENAALAAKEATVNFNRRGDWSPALGIWFEFYNAALQGSMNFLNLAFNKDWKITARSWAMIAAIAGIDILLRMMDDDDKEEDNEEKLNDYIRYSNICIPLGKGDSGKRQYLLIPKAQGVRAMSNLGNIVYDFMQGDKTIKESVVQYLNGLESDLMPISVEPVNTFNSDKTKQQLLKDIVPAAVRPLVEVMVNVDYKGDRIYRDDNAFGDITPEYKKTIGATNKYIVGTSKYLNNIFGTDELSGKWQIGKDGKATKFDVGEMLDINPSGVQHLINGYLAGIYALANKAVAFVQSDDKNLNYAPFVGDFLKSSYEESGFGLYNELKNNLRIGKMTINAINPLEDMDTYKRVRIYYDGLDRLVSPYVDIVERYNKAIENTTDEGQKAYLKQEREKALKTLKKQYDKLYEIISNINK